MRCLIGLLFLLSVTSLLAQTITVNVLTLSSLQNSDNESIQIIDEKTTLQVTVSMLDIFQKFVHFLNQSKLPVKQIQKSIIQNQQQLSQAGKGLALATALQIKKLPAIIFNQKYIVYGTTNVLDAYSLYHAWREQHGGKS